MHTAAVIRQAGKAIATSTEARIKIYITYNLHCLPVKVPDILFLLLNKICLREEWRVRMQLSNRGYFTSAGYNATGDCTRE